MGNTALNRPDPPATIEGMEPLFDVTELGSVSIEEPNELGSEPISSEAREIVSTEEAANRLGISTRAVIKRLKTGKLRGYRDSSKARAEWQIYWKEPGSEPTKTEPSNGTSRRNPEPNGSIEGTSGSEPFGTESTKYLADLNKQLLEQVQVLTYKNGYLEAQLEGRDREIRLLTDSQHKPGWWHRFSSWFFARNT